MHLAKDKFDGVRAGNLYQFCFNHLFQNDIADIEKKICKFDNLVVIITIYLNKICEFAHA